MYNDNISFDEKNHSKKKKNDKLTLIIWGIIVTIIIILSFVFMNRQSTDNKYLVFDNSGVIEYKDGKYDYTANEDYLKSSFKVFNQNDYIGTYFIVSIDDFTREVFFTSLSSEYSYIFDKPLMALSDNIEFINYEQDSFTEDDFEMFYSVSSKDYIVKKEDILDYSKVSLDLDNDGIVETLYTVTYEYIDDSVDDLETHEYNYSLFYYVKGDYIYLISEEEPYYDEDMLLFPNYLIRSVIDINDDGIYEIIVYNRIYDEPIYEIYELKGDNYQLSFSTTLGGYYE